MCTCTYIVTYAGIVTIDSFHRPSRFVQLRLCFYFLFLLIVCLSAHSFAFFDFTSTDSLIFARPLLYDWSFPCCNFQGALCVIPQWNEEKSALSHPLLAVSCFRFPMVVLSLPFIYGNHCDYRVEVFVSPLYSSVFIY